MSLLGPAPRTESQPAPKLPKGAELQLRILGRRERVVALNPDLETTIGSAPGNTIVIDDDASVSARHLKLLHSPSGVRVIDAGSTNGTWVVFPGQHQGGSRVAELAWYPGLPLRIGETELRLEVVPPAGDDEADFEGLIGRSPAMLQLYDDIDRIAPTLMPVLVLGPVGAGKELVVHALHARSHRRSKPLEMFNAAGFDGPTINSELFGHSKGAFTGADRDTQGLFVQCDGATLGLDELGELPMDVQAKLLRVLQEGEVRRVGDNRLKKVDVRVIGSTNVDLHQAIGQKAFRLDLYSRIAKVVIRVPPLIDRREDIPRLVRRALRKHAPGRDVQVSDGAMNKLLEHAWPMNVRELFSVIGLALVMASGKWKLLPEHLRFDDLPRPEAARHPHADDPSWIQLPGKTEEEVVEEAREKAVQRHGGNQAAASRELKIKPGTLNGLGKRLER